MPKPDRSRGTLRDVFILQNQRNGENQTELTLTNQFKDLVRCSVSRPQDRDENVGVENNSWFHNGIIDDTASFVNSDQAKRASILSVTNKLTCWYGA